MDQATEEALTPLQQKTEFILKKVTRQSKKLTITLYLTIFGALITFLYLWSTNLFLAIMVTVLILPLINIGFITGLGLSDDLLWSKKWFSELRKDNEDNNFENVYEVEEVKFQWILIDWSKKYLSLFQKIVLGNRTFLHLKCKNLTDPQEVLIEQ